MNNERKNLETVINYYAAMLDNKFDTMSTYLDDNVTIISPLDELHGRDNVINAAKNFGAMLKEIDIKSKFSKDNQVMLAYTMVVSEPIGKFKAAVLFTLSNSKIKNIELFYDARPFEIKKDDIFGSR
ncbi:nuclear transport factor 2 family protein [Francisella philomiragia]|uniref:nuclear transport factor 2 family protein n=1 Tax=Francisella philomiragia TaxID=28110 RepID=UPI0035161A36